MYYHPRIFYTFQLTATSFITVVTTVILAVTQQSVVNTHPIPAMEPPFSLTIIIIIVTFLPFVAPVTTVVVPVALQQLHKTLPVPASELLVSTLLVALRRLVAAVITVLVPVAVIHFVDTNPICALEVLSSANPTPLVFVLVGAVYTIRLPIAQPDLGNAPPSAVAVEVAGVALAHSAMLTLVGMVRAVGVTVALPAHGDAFAVVAPELVAAATVLWKKGAVLGTRRPTGTYCS